MRTTVQYNFMHEIKHVCQLPKEEPLLIMYISTGWCVAFRRYIRKKTLVNPKNGTAKNLYNSVSAFKTAMELHMKRDYYMIHPYSEFKMAWETFMIIVVLLSLLYYPFLVYFDEDLFTITTIIHGFFITFFTIDIGINFNTGYFCAANNKVVLNRKEVAKNYLKSWFLFDVICLVNLHGLIIVTMTVILNYLKILRISMIVRYLQGFTECTQITFYRFHFLKLIVITLIIIWWATSLLYFLVTVYDEKWMRDTTKPGKVITCFYRVSYLVFMVGFGNEYSQSNGVIIFEIICWIAGSILKIFSFAEVLQLVTKYSSSRNLYQNRIQRLKRMMRTKRLPQAIRLRILQYFDFRYQKNYFQEDEILDCLSFQLKDEVLGHGCRQLIDKTGIFNHLPSYVTENFVLKMRQIIYLKDDVIVRAGDDGGSMFFVHDGAVAIYTKDNEEVGFFSLIILFIIMFCFKICHVGDGECFGERAMILKNSKRLATVIAVDACEIYILENKDFENSLSSSPGLLDDCRKKVEEKFNKFAHIYSNKIYTL
ncbi:potassium/sodium hyperpolarization-activated cyclic nucleotide-gated channel 4-like isoform X1 [Onthophagus taurus]|uniref:potassium/sodium hyperpolarization-activated cyclic nucleotide-gated channel 4-like isoform X1 n=1 Tax=Onthophagus taurus TaxID=166361 RepID=UPI0039BE026B